MSQHHIQTTTFRHDNQNRKQARASRGDSLPWFLGVITLATILVTIPYVS